MKLILISILSIFSFLYADCEDFLTEADCGMHSECEWHADDNACEDAGGHDSEEHEESHLNFEITTLSAGSTTFSVSIMHDGHADYTSLPILVTVEEEDHDDHEGASLSFEITALSSGTATFSVSVMHDGHADYTSLPILVTVEEDHSCVAGDANNDGEVNVIDVVLSVDVILGIFVPEDICAYDFNSDGLINVVDVVQIVQYIITPTLANINGAEYIKIIQENELLSLSSDGFVQGIQMTLIHNDDFQINMVDGFVSDYRTENNSTTLILVNDGSKTITNIAIISGQYKITDVVTSARNADIDISNSLIASFELSLIGPNPFNPSTKLNIAVKESGFVNVEVFNLSGQVVASLMDGWLDQNANGHILDFDASSLSSGVYIVRAQSVNNISTQKLMLVK